MSRAKMLFMVLILAFAAYGEQKSVAILNTEDDGEPSIDFLELNHLTDKLREIAIKILSQRNYSVMNQQSILSLFDTPGDMLSKCNELAGCLVKIGREIAADYIGQGRIGRFGGNLTIKVELYESEKGILVSSFTGSSKDIYGLLSVLDEKAPDMFRRMPGVDIPSIVGGISGVQSVGGGWELNAGKRHLVNLTTEPSDASLSFNGLPSPSCAKSPCKVELPEGKIRILAVLEQYEIADTTVSIERNNQNVNVKLKPNFGVLEIKSAYSDGMGRNEQWDLSINDKVFYSLKNRLLPNKYQVKLSHRCYEDISFEVGINKGSYEVFDIYGHIKPKMGGLVLSTERDGEPSSEPVFVNGKLVGETPFSGSVAVCSDVELGREMVKLGIELKHKETVKHVHIMPSSQEWLNMIAEQRRIEMETAEEKRRRQEIEQREAEEMKRLMRPVKIGWRAMFGFPATPGGSTSEWFDMVYTNYKEMDETSWVSGGIFFAFGFTLSLWPFDVMALVTELNYNFLHFTYCYGEDCKDSDKHFMSIFVNDNTISIPVLLRFGKKTGYYFECGYQWGFPFYSSVETRKGNLFTYNDFDNDERVFNKYRQKMDQAIVLGFGSQYDNFSLGGRFIYNWTKFDRYGTFNSPIAIGFTIAYDFY